MKSSLGKRLPLIVAAVLGIWIWRGGFGLLPTERHLIWELSGEVANVRELEIQVWDGDTLIKREARTFAGGVTGELRDDLPLKKGEYTARAFIKRVGKDDAEARSSPIRVDDQETIVTRF